MKIRAHSTHSVLFNAAQAGGAPVPTRIHLLYASGFIGREGRGSYFYTFEELTQEFDAYTAEEFKTSDVRAALPYPPGNVKLAGISGIGLSATGSITTATGLATAIFSRRVW